MTQIKTDKLLSSFLVVIVVLVFITILTHITNDEYEVQKEKFIRELFDPTEAGNGAGNGAEDVCASHENILECLSDSTANCEYDEGSQQCSSVDETTNNSTNNSTEEATPNLRELEIGIITNRIGENAASMREAVRVFLEQEEQRNREVDLNSQNEKTAAQVTLNLNKQQGQLRHALLSRIGMIK